MLPISEGKRVPQATFRTRQDGQWVDVGTDQVFKGRTVIVFALPGACACAKEILERNGVVYEEVSLGKNVTFSTVRAVSGRGTAPQVFIGGSHIGGADDVEAYFAGKQKKVA